MTFPALRSSLILALTMLSPVVFHDELRSELRSSSPRGLGCRENITSEIASLADNVSTGTVRCGLPSDVNSTIPAMPIVESGSGAGLSCGNSFRELYDLLCYLILDRSYFFQQSASYRWYLELGYRFRRYVYKIGRGVILAGSCSGYAGLAGSKGSGPVLVQRTTRSSNSPVN